MLTGAAAAAGCVSTHIALNWSRLVDVIFSHQLSSQCTCCRYDNRRHDNILLSLCRLWSRLIKHSSRCDDCGSWVGAVVCSTSLLVTSLRCCRLSSLCRAKCLSVLLRSVYVDPVCPTAAVKTAAVRTAAVSTLHWLKTAAQTVLREFYHQDSRTGDHSAWSLECCLSTSTYQSRYLTTTTTSCSGGLMSTSESMDKLVVDGCESFHHCCEDDTQTGSTTSSSQHHCYCCCCHSHSNDPPRSRHRRLGAESCDSSDEHLCDTAAAAAAVTSSQPTSHNDADNAVINCGHSVDRLSSGRQTSSAAADAVTMTTASPSAEQQQQQQCVSVLDSSLQTAGELYDSRLLRQLVLLVVRAMYVIVITDGQAADEHAGTLC